MNISITTSHTNFYHSSLQSSANCKLKLSYSDANANGSINTSSEIISENNYYPFGLQHKGYNNYASANANDIAEKFKYNGKQLNDEFNINWYDFGARNYDAALGRWMNVDPLAENGRRWSPYNHSFNNPIYFQDPDGMWPNPFQGWGKGIARAVQNRMTKIGNSIKPVLEKSRDFVRNLSMGAGAVEVAMGVATISSGGSASPITGVIAGAAETISLASDITSLAISTTLNQEKEIALDAFNITLPAFLNVTIAKNVKKSLSKEIKATPLKDAAKSAVDVTIKVSSFPVKELVNEKAKRKNEENKIDQNE